jgi:threonine synthase
MTPSVAQHHHEQCCSPSPMLAPQAPPAHPCPLASRRAASGARSLSVLPAVAHQAMTTSQLHVETPLVHSNALTQALGTGAPVFLKLENAQPSGSFKLRGCGAACASAVTQSGATRLVSSSGGNAGLAVAHSARALGVDCTVVRRQQLTTLTTDRKRLTRSLLTTRSFHAQRLKLCARGWLNTAQRWSSTGVTGLRHMSRR